MLKHLLNFSKKPDSDPILQYADIVDDDEDDDLITAHERTLLSNILKLRDETVINVMVPRADIIAVDVNTPLPDLLTLLSAHQFSRLPVYEDNLDHVIGSLHIKDIMAAMAAGKEVSIRDAVTDIPVISPAMPTLDLILEMRQSRRHMALVVDEHGGIDGLVTLNDIIEEIVGEIEDEHDNEADEPQMIREENGSILADARIHLDDFEAAHGAFLDQEERDEIETLGGLVFAIAGRIPKRGEVLKHKSGMVFEVLEADPRRVHKVRVRDIPVGS